MTKIIRKDDDNLADGNISALPDWSERNSKLYDGETSKQLLKQNHTCAYCGLKFTSEERVHLHHKDGNHDNWKKNNLVVLHGSCHDYVHMSKEEVKFVEFSQAQTPTRRVRRKAKRS